MVSREPVRDNRLTRIVSRELFLRGRTGIMLLMERAGTRGKGVLQNSAEARRWFAKVDHRWAMIGVGQIIRWSKWLAGQQSARFVVPALMMPAVNRNLRGWQHGN